MVSRPMGVSRKGCGQDLMKIPQMALTADQAEAFEERAGIMEYDGGLPRAKAERLALQDVLGNLRSSASQECLQGANYGTKALRSAGGG